MKLWGDKKLSAWNNSKSIQILHQKQFSELEAAKEESSDFRSNDAKLTILED